jgi:hypothetical protein
MRFTTSALLLSLALSAAGAQTADTLSLAGRNSLMFNFGFASSTTASAVANQTSVRTSGEIGSFSYHHWLRPQVGLSISAGVLNAEATTNSSRANANAIVPFLFGLDYSPSALALTRSLRPFVAAAVGPYVHNVDEVSAGIAEAYTETVAGARLSTGINWFAARHFMMTLEGHYNAVGEFSRQDAVTRDPSGFGFSLGLGFSWGGRY